MSSRAARPFLPDLRELERRLRVPLPERVRILRELEYDLERLRDGLVARGVAADEARSRALEALLPDRLAREELGRVHTPLYRRLTRSLDGDRLRLAERWALVLLRVDLLDDPSPFLWPILALGAVLFAMCAARVFELWVKGEHRRPDRGLQAILGLSAAIPVAGLAGVVADLYRLARILQGAPHRAGALVLDWLVRDCVLLSVSILLAMAGGLVWFVLSRWVALLSGARRELLGLEPGDSLRQETAQ